MMHDIHRVCTTLYLYSTYMQTLGFYLCICQEREKCLHMSRKYGSGLVPNADAAERDDSGERGVLLWEPAVCQSSSPEQVSGNRNKYDGPQTRGIYPKRMKILCYDVLGLCSIMPYNSLKIGNLEMSYVATFS